MISRFPEQTERLWINCQDVQCQKQAALREGAEGWMTRASTLSGSFFLSFIVGSEDLGLP